MKMSNRRTSFRAGVNTDIIYLCIIYLLAFIGICTVIYGIVYYFLMVLKIWD